MNLTKIKGRDNLPVKSKKIDYPQPVQEDLPNNFYTCIAIGSTGAGKTYSIVKLLKYLEECKNYYSDGTEAEQRIILVSPTYRTNPLWDTLKYLDPCDIHEEYSKALILDIIDEVDRIRKAAEKYQKTLQAWKKYTRNQHLTPKELILLYTIDFKLKNLAEPEYKAPPITHLILDDLICCKAYAREGVVSNLSVKNRHKMINLYILSQTANQIPKVIRLQARLLFIYRYNSKNIIEDLYDLVAGILSPEQFEKIYFDATEEKYTFLCIDNTKKDIVLKQNLDAIINYVREKPMKQQKKAERRKEREGKGDRKDGTTSLAPYAIKE